MNNEQKIKLIQKAIEDKTGTKVEVVINPVGDISFFTKFGVWKISPEILELLPISDPLEEQPDKGWIPVSERLPEPHSIVSVYVPTRKMAFMASWQDAGMGFHWNSPYDEIFEGITHWQPLPNPPQAPVKQG